MNRIFYQDFLMDYPYDDKEFPIVNIRYINNLQYAQEYGEPFNLFDIENGQIRWISFQYLHNLTDANVWNKIFQDVMTLDGIILVDDIPIVNDGVVEMKDFYLKNYYWNLEQYNKNIWLFTQL